MKKKINVDDWATSNLRGESVFFPMKNEQASPALAGDPQENTTSSEEPQKQKARSDIVIPPQTTQKILPERANVRTTERPNGRRIITRNSFEIYEDQMDSLRQLAYTEKMQGKIGSMSAMVREAIDTYILKKSSEK